MTAPINANDIINASYTAVDIDATTGTNGYYSKFNTSTTQSLSGTAMQAIIQGASNAVPVEIKTDVQTLSDFRLGTLLRRKGIISGDLSSIVDGAIDFLRTDNETSSKFIVPKFTHTTRFIPIVIKSEFLLQRNAANTSRSNFYIIFDSTPEKINLSKSAAWNQKEFYGRPEPIQVFGSSSAVTFSLTGMFFSDSEGDHVAKLELENRLFALVTPSKNHFMPTPVEVKIGEWKRLRCIVTNVSIDYQGPWRTTSSPTKIAASQNTDITTTNRSLPSHSPYLFEATFQLTVVSELNTVQYAEDIIDFGFNGGYSDNGSLGTINTLNETLGEIGIPGETASTKYRNSSFAIEDNGTSIVYTIKGNAGEVGTLIDSASSFANTTQYLKSLGLPTDSNGSTKTAALAQITSGLTAITQTYFSKN